MNEFSCIRCRRMIADGSACPFCRMSAINRLSAYKICETNQCGHFVVCNETGQMGCDLHPVKPCMLDNHLLDFGSCFRDPPMFSQTKPEFEPTIDMPVPEFQPTIINRKSELAIVVFKIGEQVELYSRYTLPRIAKYAAKCGAELVIIDDDQWPDWPIGNKLRFGQIAAHYSRTVLIDLDVWIADSAPSIFDTHDSGHIWMHDDRNSVWPSGRVYLAEELRKMAKRHGLKWTGKIRNTGVILLDQIHAESWELPEQIRTTHTAEQAWIDLMLSAKWADKMRNLEPSYNWLFFHPHFEKYRRKAHFVHLANATFDERMRLFSDLEREYREPYTENLQGV